MTTLEAVRAFRDEVSDRAAETEAARCVPPDLAHRLGATGVFRMFVPSKLGGDPVDPLTAYAIVAELARADASTGWTSMILNTTFFSSWLEPEVARAILETEPSSGMAGMFAPIGRTEPAGDGMVRLTGRYPFNSGSPHASWFCEGAFVTGVSGAPEWRFLFLPKSDVEILDTWRVAGLRGTASHDVLVDGVLVPLDRTASPVFDRAPHDEPHYRWSFFALLGSLMAGVPIGVARRALDEFFTLAERKSRGGEGSLATEQVTQLAVAQCEGSLRAAASFVEDSIGAAWDTALVGDDISREQRLTIRLAVSHAMRACLDVVDTVFALAGGGALFDDNPLQRCWRDLHAASSHIFFSTSFGAFGGKVLLNQPVEEFRM